jgi:uncharacterized damage-inducible protein DinB
MNGGTIPELEQYLGRIEDLRGLVCDLIRDVPAEALNWRPLAQQAPEATNSLAVLATHIAGAEQFWIGEVVGGNPPARDRDAEFATQSANAQELVYLLEKTGAETRQRLAALDREGLEGVREVRGRRVPVRWCILHVIDHTALHLGHMQLTFQLWQGGAGKPSPFWFERLRDD